MDGLKLSIDEVNKNMYTRLDEKLPATTMREIQQKLRKESDLARKVEALGPRMTNVKNFLVKKHKLSCSNNWWLHKLQPLYFYLMITKRGRRMCMFTSQN